MRRIKQRGQKQMEPKRRRLEENIEAKTEGKERLKMMPKRAIKNIFKQFDLLKQKYIPTSDTLH